VTVNVVLPAATPVTSPVFETVAVAVFAICHVARLVTFSTSPVLASTMLAEY
jgi:hypothetical protein